MFKKALLFIAALGLGTSGIFTPSAMAEVRLVGSGASFPAPIYTTWFRDFSRATDGVQVNYQSKGSGAGIRDLQNRTVDFAASDAAMTAEQMAVIEEGVQLLPMTAGEVVLAYNLDGIESINLPRAVYAGIFMGQIKKWNNPAIAAANPGVALPDMDITVVTRADSSGTTFVYTMHLSAINDGFKNTIGHGTTVQWPADAKMIRAPKNDGVTATIMQTPGAIGYIEYGFARMAKLSMASLENKEGSFVAPGAEGGQEALANAEIPEDMIVWLSDPAGENAYPIATYTWMLFYKKYDDPQKAAAIRDMITYCLDHGQALSEKAGYIPLPENVIERVRTAAQNIH